MKTTLAIKSLLTAGLWMAVMSAAAVAAGIPKIQFEQTVIDFGKVSLVESVSGAFKFKNIGDAVLKLDPPKPSCGCTVAELKTDTLQPGESGELAFTLNLGRARATMEKHISVTSNDPASREVSLAIKVDYTPLYDINPMTISPNLAFGVNEAEQFTTITRTDGKPLRIARLDPSKPWITATMETEAKEDSSKARVRVGIKRDGPPRRFNESIQVYSADKTNGPVTTIFLYGQVLGEVTLSPEVLYWSLTGAAQKAAERPEGMITRRLTVQSANGKPLELKNPQSTIKGIQLDLVTKDAGKVYELVAKLNDLPAETVSGTVSFETSVASQARIEVPVIVNVFKQ